MSDLTKTARPVALVTGASAGIGVELARVFAREGHDLVLVARRTEPMQQLAAELEKSFGAKSLVVGADLTASDAARVVKKAVDDAGLAVDVLVNNAGFGLTGVFHELPGDAQAQMVGLNCTTLTTLSHAFLPGMVERKRGGILNVASTAGFQPGPFMATYYATKAYVVSLSHALNEELRGTGVHVTALCPGFTVTEFAKVASAHGKENRLFNGEFGALSAKDVAEAGYRALKANRRTTIPGLLNRVAAASTHVTPTALLLKIARRLNTPA